MNIEIAKKILKTNPGKSKLVILAQGLESSRISKEYAEAEKREEGHYTFILTSYKKHKEQLLFSMGIKDHGLKVPTKKKREKNYQKGGVFLSTELIFFMDVESGRIQPDKISSVLILGRSSVKKYETIAVAINEIKRKNPLARVHVFVSDIVKMSIKKGLKPMMSNFHLKDFSLWPRSRKELLDWEASIAGISKVEFMDVEVPLEEEHKELAFSVWDALRSCHKEASRLYKKKVRGYRV